jgi:hypothetical protein
LALQSIDLIMAGDTTSPGFDVINLGTGRGTTVLELVESFESVTGVPVRVDAAPPRDGDTAGCCASAHKASRVLGWKAEFGIDDGIRDALAWRARLPEVLRQEQQLEAERRHAGQVVMELVAEETSVDDSVDLPGRWRSGRRRGRPTGDLASIGREQRSTFRRR